MMKAWLVWQYIRSGFVRVMDPILFSVFGDLKWTANVQLLYNKVCMRL